MDWQAKRFVQIDLTDVWYYASPNQSFQADRDPRERGPRPLNSNR
jgi:hypothetical protein